MGGASSKTARRLPTRSTQPTVWSGARAPRSPTGASETKDAAIQEDGADPQFMAQLHRLGPVTVNHHMRPVLPGTENMERFRRRQLSETQASSPGLMRNHVLARTLTQILDERKGMTSRHQVEALAKQHDLDPEVLEGVARFISSPSVDPASVKQFVTEEGPRTTMVAKWVDPCLDQ